MLVGMQTPWGIAHIQRELDEGVLWVETREHGGILIKSAKAQEILSPRARAIGKDWNGFLAFEQEVDMMVIFYEHPELYPWVEDELIEQFAEESIRSTYPTYFAA